MSERIHQLAQLLPGKSSIEECSTEELQHLAKRYPYFAPLQFLLLQKLKSTGSPDAEMQERRAVLYYHDPLQFEHFIYAEKFLTDETGFTHEGEQTPAAAPAIETSETPAVATDTLVESSPVLQNEGEGIANEITTKGETTAVGDTQQLLPPAHDIAESVAPPEPLIMKTGERTSEEDKPGEETIAVTAPISSLNGPVLEGSSGEAYTENAKENVSPVLTTIATPEQETIKAHDEKETPIGEIEEATPEVVTPVLPAPQIGGTLAFEPYHTVDYFASQGIKITTEELPKDKLGKQLRSFTEWLKMMKRLPATEMAKAPESSAEKTVESLASHSVAESDVVTEAMAEVWAKQGAREKAIETYNKLSLLNPSKKAYFAAKIENLNQS